MVGKELTAEEKSRILESTAEWFQEQTKLREELERTLNTKERDKTPEEHETIALVDNATNEILEKYGLRPLRLSSEHVHLLRHDAYEKLFPGAPKGGARYIPPHQAILLSDVGPEARVEFAQNLFHEMIHFKFWNALQRTEPQKKLQTYRTGLAIVSRDGKEIHLRNLNEAVTEYLTEEFFETKLKNDPRFASDAPRGERPPRGYAGELENYRNLLQAIESNTGARITSAEAHELFVRAAATGNILPLARLIERTLGKASFRLLGGGETPDNLQEPGAKDS